MVDPNIPFPHIAITGFSLQAHTVTSEDLTKAVQGLSGMCHIPFFTFAWQQMSIPSVWPKEGTVKALQEHYYGEGQSEFPPPGFMLEVMCADPVPKVSL